MCSSFTAMNCCYRTGGTGESSACLDVPSSRHCLLILVDRPDVDFMCNIDFDPFVYMEEHNKTYGALFSRISF